MNKRTICVDMDCLDHKLKMELLDVLYHIEDSMNYKCKSVSNLINDLQDYSRNYVKTLPKEINISRQDLAHYPEEDLTNANKDQVINDYLSLGWDYIPRSFNYYIEYGANGLTEYGIVNIRVYNIDWE